MDQQYVIEEAEKIIHNQQSRLMSMAAEARAAVSETVLLKLSGAVEDEPTACWMKDVKAQAEESLEQAAFINAREQAIRAICKGLDARTRAILQTVVKIMDLDGYSVGVKFGQELMFDWHDPETLQSTLESFDDPDMELLAEVHKAAIEIEEIEENRRLI